MLIVHLNTFRWPVPWDGMVKGREKVELNSEGKGGMKWKVENHWVRRDKLSGCFWLGKEKPQGISTESLG